MWQVKNSTNCIDYRPIGNYYRIDCECGYRAIVIKRKFCDKKIAKIIRHHACEREGK